MLKKYKTKWKNRQSMSKDQWDKMLDEVFEAGRIFGEQVFMEEYQVEAELGAYVVNISEAAKFLNVDVQTLRRWDNSGKLKAFRPTITSPRRYRREDLIKFTNTKHNEKAKLQNPIR